MRLTIDIPDALHRKAKAAATKRGRTLTHLVVEALREKLQHSSPRPGEPEWMKLFGAFGKTAAQRAENRPIEKIIEDAFETVDPERDIRHD